MTRWHRLHQFLLAALAGLPIGVTAEIVNIDAQEDDIDQPVTIMQLGPGDYEVSPVGDEFVAWSHRCIENPSPCGSLQPSVDCENSVQVSCNNPEGCSLDKFGWIHRYVVDFGEGPMPIWDHKIYPTPQDALAAAPTVSFHLDEASDVHFYVTDKPNEYDDNMCGVSVDVKPRLAIVPPPETSTELDYCNRTEDGLLVTFQNSGTQPSGGTMVRVSFSPYEGAQQMLLAIPAGETAELAFPFPEGCFDPQCDFSINWYDNNVSGSCLEIASPPPLGKLELMPPVESSSAIDYCIRTEEGLIVSFKNSGTAPTGGRTVKVVFDGTGSLEETLLAILPGDTADLVFPIPSSCFSPECKFNIKWDDKSVGGYCL